MTADRPEVDVRLASHPNCINSSIELLGPTMLEYAMVRLLRPNYALRRAGVRLNRWRPADGVDAVIVCGIAGSLVDELRPGDVLVPDAVTLAGSSERECDPELVKRLQESARRRGYEPRGGRLLTASDIVTDPDRERWAARGFEAADMELGLLPDHLRIATVRVILDAPGKPISAAWERPSTAMLRRDAWSEFGWLARSGPRYALRAARIADDALRRL